MTSLIEQVHSREWFYAYELPDGSSTTNDMAFAAVTLGGLGRPYGALVGAFLALGLTAVFAGLSAETSTTAISLRLPRAQ